MTESYSILARVIYDEAPFIYEFIYHYMRIGFDHVYLINSEGDSNYIYDQLPISKHHFVTVINLPKEEINWQEKILDRAISFVKEDWILNIDMDEFLWLDIKFFIPKIPSNIEKIRFSWLMCLSTMYTQNSIFDICSEPIYISKSFKTMARRSSIVKMGIHDIVTSNNQNIFFPDKKDNAFILHFACRGFFDLINRIIGRNYENDKSGRDQELLLVAFLKDKTLPQKEFPFRFNMFRIELSFPRIDFDLHRSLDSYNGVIDNDLLQRIFIEKLLSIGFRLPSTENLNIASFIEKEFELKKRILRGEVNPDFSRMHFDENMSYVKITQRYNESLRC